MIPARIFFDMRLGPVSRDIENGIADNRATGSILLVPLFLALKAEALRLADRTSEALEAIGEAEALAERFEVYGGVPNCTGFGVCF